MWRLVEILCGRWQHWRGDSLTRRWNDPAGRRFSLSGLALATTPTTSPAPADDVLCDRRSTDSIGRRGGGAAAAFWVADGCRGGWMDGCNEINFDFESQMA